MKYSKYLFSVFLFLFAIPFASASDSHDSHDSIVSASNASCVGQVISVCGMKVLKTKCTGVTVSSSVSSSDQYDEDRDHGDSDSRKYNEVSHLTHEDRSDEDSGRYVTICHRMGGAETPVSALNDGSLHGHANHVLDTVGTCEHFDSELDSTSTANADRTISASDSGFAAGITAAQVACLSGGSSGSFKVNGVEYQGGGLNSRDFTVALYPPRQGPSRGGMSSAR